MGLLNQNRVRSPKLGLLYSQLYDDFCRNSATALTRHNKYVIDNGRFIGDFDGLYGDIPAPWGQSRASHRDDTRRQLAVLLCERLRSVAGHSELNRVVEIGCGFGFLTDQLREVGFSSVGVDISLEAIAKARSQNPASVYLRRNLDDPALLTDLDPDLVILADVSWYVLDSLETFLERLREHARQRSRATYLIHLLATYGPGIQEYGRDFFTDLDGILEYFNLEYLEAGTIYSPRAESPHSYGTYFVGKVPR